MSFSSFHAEAISTNNRWRLFRFTRIVKTKPVESDIRLNHKKILREKYIIESEQHGQ